MPLFIATLLLIISFPVKAEDHEFESWNKAQFQNYPFKCVKNGTTPEMARCVAEKLNRNDWELRKELNNDDLWNKWRDARANVCYHYKDKHFGQGTVKPLMSLSCELRLNSEVKRFCITGEDKKCG